MASVYLWKISADQKRVGHLSLRLHDEEKTYISFWPASSNKALSCKSTFRSFDEDVKLEGGQPDDSYEIPMELINLQKIRSWWTEVAKKRDYSLFKNNCARTVYLALKEGGLKVFKQDTIATASMYMQFPDDDDLSYEEIQTRKEIMDDGGIEDLPIAPATAFEWIKERVEEEKSGSQDGTTIADAVVGGVKWVTAKLVNPFS